MLKFTENFYLYGVEGSLLSSANANFNTQWITHGSRPALITSGFRANAKALSLPRNAQGSAQVERRFSSEEDVVIVGYAFRSTQRGATTFSIRDGDDVLVDLEWPNQFQVNGVAGAATILLNKVYFVEVKLVKSTSQVIVHVNGYPYLETTALQTVPNDIQCFWGFPEAGSNADFFFSDVSFVDSSAGKVTDFMGPHKVVTRLNTEEVEPGWTPVPGSRTRLEIMNNMPPQLNEYTESDTVGTKDFYKSNNEVEADAVINGVAVTTLITKTDIDEQYIALAVSDGAADKLGDDIEVPIQPTYFQEVFETDIDDADWTPATVVDAAYGPVIRPRP